MSSAPAITRLEGSSTRPLMFPLGDCPKARRTNRTRPTTRKGTRGKRIQILQRATSSQPLTSCSQEGAQLYQQTPILARKQKSEETGLRVVGINSEVCEKKRFAARFITPAMRFYCDEYGVNL